MMLERVTRCREVVGRAGAVLCVLLILGVLDGVMAQFRHPLNVFELIRGGEVKVNGPLKADINEVDGLIAVSDSDLIRLSFQGVQTGFWLGQKMWRGVIEVNPQIEPGKYGLTVGLKADVSGKPLSSFTIIVYRDYGAYCRDSLSYCLRYLEISPWSALAGLFPATCLVFGAVYLLSRKEDELMALEGRAEIYKIAKGDWGYEIAFGLGTRHGVKVGTSFALLDENGRQVGVVAALKVSATDATAQVGIDCEVMPGYSVKKL